MVQALVDSEGRFLDVSAGWPSTTEPITILRQTKLFSGVEESRELLNGPSYELSDGNSIPQYILGDSCFLLLPWLLTPFIRSNKEDSFSSSERAFNSAHSQGMGLVGTAFGRVCARWLLLSRRWKEECIEFLPFVIVAGCLLHNFLIKCSELLPEENVGYSKEPELRAFKGKANENGLRIRDALAFHLSRVSLRREFDEMLSLLDTIQNVLISPSSCDRRSGESKLRNHGERRRGIKADLVRNGKRRQEIKADLA
ncbi:hypothetical protein L1049_000287 [Liquidambar formosana]|uniref:DDE Tnp4 domain-containing protein n=1 Tax=Liquidambar formosana TaxID=63359 RepID=A0AAP0NCH9_LIQFO